MPGARVNFMPCALKQQKLLERRIIYMKFNVIRFDLRHQSKIRNGGLSLNEENIMSGLVKTIKIDLAVFKILLGTARSV